VIVRTFKIEINQVNNIIILINCDINCSKKD